MCGIFGIFLNNESRYPSGLIQKLVTHLFILSESRGKDAAGIAIISQGEHFLYKEPVCASIFIRKKTYKEFIAKTLGNKVDVKRRKAINKPLVILGHARLATNGDQNNIHNNSPIVSDGVVGVHNGIIVNDAEIYNLFPLGAKKGIADSETLFSLLSYFINKDNLSLISAIKLTYGYIEGLASIAAVIFKHNYVLLATNNGSIHFCNNVKKDILLFASESFMLYEVIKKFNLSKTIGDYHISQLRPNSAILLNLFDFSAEAIDLAQSHSIDKSLERA